MESDQKETIILKYLTRAFLFIFFIVVVFVVYTNLTPTKVEKYDETYNVPEINLLTKSQFEFEKQKIRNEEELKYRQQVFSENKQINNYTSPTQELTIQQKTSTSEHDVNVNVNVDFIEIKRVKEIRPDGTVTFYTEKVNANEYSNNIPTVSVDILKQLSDTGEKILVFLEGTIHQTDFATKQIIIMKKGGGLSTFSYDDKTKFIVNGNLFKPTELVPGDIVEVEGYLYHGTDHIFNTMSVTYKGGQHLI